MPATAMRPPKTPSTISAPIAVSIGNTASVRSLRSTRHDNLPRYHERWIRPPISPSRVDRSCRLTDVGTHRRPTTTTPGARPGASTSSATTPTTRTGSACRWRSTANAASSVTPRRRPAGSARHSAQLDGEVDVARRRLYRARRPSSRAWGRFVAGAVRAVASSGATTLPAADLAVSSTVPAGSGLSSSSALTVALTVDVRRPRRDRRSTAPTLAARCARGRSRGHRRARRPHGPARRAVRANRVTRSCSTAARCTSTRSPIPRSVGVVVVHSGEPRTLADSAYAERRAACEAAAARLGAAAPCATPPCSRCATIPAPATSSPRTPRARVRGRAPGRRRRRARAADAGEPREPPRRLRGVDARARPRSSTRAWSTARSARASPAPGSAAASSRSCSATTPTTCWPKWPAPCARPPAPSRSDSRCGPARRRTRRLTRSHRAGRGYIRPSSSAFFASYSSGVMWPWSRRRASCSICSGTDAPTRRRGRCARAAVWPAIALRHRVAHCGGVGATTAGSRARPSGGRSPAARRRGGARSRTSWCPAPPPTAPRGSRRR